MSTRCLRTVWPPSDRGLPCVSKMACGLLVSRPVADTRISRTATSPHLSISSRPIPTSLAGTMQSSSGASTSKVTRAQAHRLPVLPSLPSSWRCRTNTVASLLSASVATSGHTHSHQSVCSNAMPICSLLARSIPKLSSGSINTRPPHASMTPKASRGDPISQDLPTTMAYATTTVDGTEPST